MVSKNRIQGAFSVTNWEDGKQAHTEIFLSQFVGYWGKSWVNKFCFACLCSQQTLEGNYPEASCTSLLHE